MDYSNKVEVVKNLIRCAYWAASTAHKMIIPDPCTNENVGAMFLNKAISLMSSAQAIYINDYDHLANETVEEIFQTFSTFESEYLDNIKTNHSHQWSDIEFNRFEEVIKSFINGI